MYDDDASQFSQLDSLIAAQAGIDEALLPLATVQARHPKARDDIRRLEKIDAIKRICRRDGFYLSRIDAQRVSLRGDMRAAGFTEELGLTPEVCKLHVEATQALAHEELRSSPPTSAASATKTRPRTWPRRR
ncbi:MAG: hypothetical protein Q8M37_10650 [Nevskia sp.]|nr:hypothetical protein [Nevskia sp.]